MKREAALKVAKPILFNTKMVRAIQDSRKTVTRRVLKNQDPERAFSYDYVNDTDGIAREVDLICDMGNNVLEAMVNKIPYFAGDILYVRETWCKGKFRGEEEQYMPFGYREIVHDLFLLYTGHSGGTSTNAKCRMLGVDPCGKIDICEVDEDDE